MDGGVRPSSFARPLVCFGYSAGMGAVLLIPPPGDERRTALRAHLGGRDLPGSVCRYPAIR